MLAEKLSGASADKIFSDDVFSSFRYTGNGSTKTINNGIDLAGKGGMVWTKQRSPNAYQHNLNDTVQGAGYRLRSEATAAAVYVADTTTSFSSTGYTLGADSGGLLNQSGSSFASWTFRNAPKFHLTTTVTKSAGSNATVDLSSLGTVGMVMVKRTDAAGSWYVFHRSATAGKLLYLEQTAVEATLGHITVSGTTLTLVNGVITDGSYAVYAWAHDTSADGIVQCGSFTTDASGNATVNLGWEPQFLMLKTTAAAQNWFMFDTSRGFVNSINSSLRLCPNVADAESAHGGTLTPTATGFQATAINLSYTYIYLAIRRPNKPPTLGTQVYNAIARDGTYTNTSITGVGFTPDLVLSKSRYGTDPGAAYDRLRGPLLGILPAYTTAEVSSSGTLTSFDMDGVSVGLDGSGYINFYSGRNYINHFFKRAPGVMDVVCYTGDAGFAVNYAHNLGVQPELVISKCRSTTSNWGVNFRQPSSLWLTSGTPGGFVLNSSAATTTVAGYDVMFTSTMFGPVFVGAGNEGMNTYGATYVSYLFATKAGISKVGSYTGNGTSQTINCGFTTGSRFILIKRTDAAGDWYVFDTIRGIVDGTDPHLSLNTTAAEVTTDDSIDPDTSGFIVNQLAATNLNVTSATYIYLSFA